MNNQDTIDPGTPKGYESQSPLLIMQRSEGLADSGYLKHLYHDGRLYEYTNEKIDLTPSGEVIIQNGPFAWHLVIQITDLGVKKIVNLIQSEFSLIDDTPPPNSDLGSTKYTAFVNRQNYYWGTSNAYFTKDSIIQNIEYLINTHIILD